MGTHTDHSIYVAGHRGMVGSAIVRRLRALGYQNIVTATPNPVRSVFKFDPTRALTP